MRVLLMSLALLTYVPSFASTSLVVNRGLIETPAVESEGDNDESGSIIIGKAAEERFQSLKMKFFKHESGVSMYGDDLNMGRGENGDVVYESYESVEQVLENKGLVVSCEAHTHEIVRLVNGTADDYTDNYFCDVMPLK